METIETGRVVKDPPDIQNINPVFKPIPIPKDWPTPIDFAYIERRIIEYLITGR